MLGRLKVFYSIILFVLLNITISFNVKINESEAEV